MVMCAFSSDRKQLQFACAMNPLWVIRKNQVIEYRPDKFPVGEYVGDERPFSLLQHTCEAGDMIYIFSDGYADQFGGPDGKKLKYKQLRDILCEVAEMPCNDQQQIIEERFRKWQGEHEQVDDVLVIGIRI
jgi:serine phosphatase RsbU (regulator of sigma subunit)